MSRQPWAIKPSEVRRTVTAVLQAGLGVREVRFERGGFSVVPGKSADEASETPNPWDQVNNDPAKPKRTP